MSSQRSPVCTRVGRGTGPDRAASRVHAAEARCMCACIVMCTCLVTCMVACMVARMSMLMCMLVCMLVCMLICMLMFVGMLVVSLMLRLTSTLIRCIYDHVTVAERQKQARQAEGRRAPEVLRLLPLRRERREEIHVLSALRCRRRI